MTETQPYAAEVARGADLVEEKFPGALANVDLTILRIRSLAYCVLGQSLPVELSYSEKLFALGINIGDQSRYGFSIPPGHDLRPGSWDALDEAWRIEIKNRV